LRNGIYRRENRAGEPWRASGEYFSSTPPKKIPDFFWASSVGKRSGERSGDPLRNDGLSCPARSARAGDFGTSLSAENIIANDIRERKKILCCMKNPFNKQKK
jgi:hypothetical protein